MFHDRIIDAGQHNAFAQVVLKLLSPGIPDIYQGQELWDYSLVDPDNRRPVDFAFCRRALDELRSFAANARRRAETLAKDRTCEARTRATQKEILEWITVWMQTPALFADWVELRRRSPDFRKQFLDDETSTG